jgi:hypothetical protein
MGKDKLSKQIWTRIGTVQPNKSGKGLHLTWDYFPLGAGLTVMLPYDKESGEAAPPEVEHELDAANLPMYAGFLIHSHNNSYLLLSANSNNRQCILPASMMVIQKTSRDLSILTVRQMAVHSNASHDEEERHWVGSHRSLYEGMSRV